MERVDAAAPVLEEVSRKAFTFNHTFALVFDQAHNLQFNAFGAERYLWDVFNFTADANGRLFAIINVELFAPAQVQTTDFLGINHVTGELEKHSTAYIDAFMPVDVGPVWALLDLEASLIVASTVGETMTVASEAHAEAPPFAHPSYVRLDGFEPIYTAGIWLKPISMYEGGPLAGTVLEEVVECHRARRLFQRARRIDDPGSRRVLRGARDRHGERPSSRRPRHGGPGLDHRHSRGERA